MKVDDFELTVDTITVNQKVIRWERNVRLILIVLYLLYLKLTKW